MNEWGYNNQQLNDFIHEIVDRGITTMDHADIYGNYTCESLFGDALALTPNLREKLKSSQNAVLFYRMIKLLKILVIDMIKVMIILLNQLINRF